MILPAFYLEVISMGKKKKPQASANNGLERREFLFDVTAENDDSGHYIVGRPIVYDSTTNLGDFDEVIVRGALDDTNLRDVRFLVNHNLSMIPLARSRRNNLNSTMQLITDEAGMGIRVNLDTENNADSRSLYSAVGRGDISGMSFLFGVDAEEWLDLESDHPTRRIKSISTVVEISAVTFPAYDATTIETRDKEALESARSALEKARRSLNHPLDSGRATLALLKEQAKILGGF